MAHTQRLTFRPHPITPYADDHGAQQQKKQPQPVVAPFTVKWPDAYQLYQVVSHPQQLNNAVKVPTTGTRDQVRKLL